MNTLSTLYISLLTWLADESGEADGGSSNYLLGLGLAVIVIIALAAIMPNAMSQFFNDLLVRARGIFGI